AAHQFEAALGMLRAASRYWQPTVVTVSAAAGTGVDAFWAEVERFRKVMTESGELAARRQRQAVDWVWVLVDGGLRGRFRNHPRVRHDLEPALRDVAGGRMTPAAAAHRLLGHLDGTADEGPREKGDGVDPGATRAPPTTDPCPQEPLV